MYSHFFKRKDPMKQKYLYLLLLLSLSNAYGVCTNSGLTRGIVIDTFCTLTTCCVDLAQDIADLDTTLTDCCADLKDSITVCCADLAQDIADLDTTLTVCCADLKDTITNLSVNVIVTVTAVGPCDPTPITSAQVISSAGTFCLANDIIGTITIDADLVVLDLNGKEISGAANGVVITSNHQCIVVENGFIKDTTLEGIRVNTDCSEVLLKDLVVVNCGSSGTGQDAFGIRFISCNNCFGDQCIVADGFQGISFFDTSRSTLNNCHVLSCTQFFDDTSGFFFSGANNSAFNCSAVTIQSTFTGGSIVVIGFNAATGADQLILKNCSARDISVTGSSSALGFGLRTSDCCVVENSIAEQISAQDVFGFAVRNRCCLKNCTAQCITGTAGAGFQAFADNNIISDCKAIDLIGSATISGFEVGGTGDNNIIDSCIANRVMSSGSDGVGFRIVSVANTDNLISNCIAQDCTIGFFSTAVLSNSFINNVSKSNTTPYFIGGTTSGKVSAPEDAVTVGFNISN